MQELSLSISQKIRRRLSKPRENLYFFRILLRERLVYFQHQLLHFLLPKRYHLHTLSIESAQFFRKPLGSRQWVGYLQEPFYKYYLNKGLINLISTKFGEQIARDGTLSLQSFALSNNRSFCHNSVFRGANQESIDRQLKRVIISQIVFTEPTVVLAYNTTHFGHFLAEALGGILFYSDLLGKEGLSKSHNFLLISPSTQWTSFIQELRPNINFTSIKSNTLLNCSIAFRNAILIKHFSSWQSLSIARNTMLGYLYERGTHGPLKLYLNCKRRQQIANHGELNSWLISNGFQSIDPLDFHPKELFQLLHDAKVVISTQGSISLNLLLTRLGKTIILTPSNFESISLGDFAGGIVFNTFGYGFMDELPCEVIGNTSSRKHFYSSQILVDIKLLENLVASYILES